MRLNKLFKLLGIIILLTFTANIGFAADVEMMGARLTQAGNDTRIVFEFDKATQYNIFTLTKPNRLVLDVTNTSLKTNLKLLPLQSTPINDVRIAPFNPNTLRIVFDLKSALKVKTSYLNPIDGYGYRLSVDLTDGTATSPETSTYNSTPATATETSSSAPVQAVTASSVLSSGLGRNIIVVIDPGHGGKDPGATGPLGVHEKNVVLTIAKDIENDINAVPGMSTKMTRYGDYFITLRDRLDIARQDHADFFVAVHADAFINRDATGASVFALSQRGATSEAARWLAEKENYSELGGVDLANKSEELRSVLIDLSQTATITQSLDIGQMVVNSIAKITPMHSDDVEQARFVVLKSPDIPSLLVETGFISNPQEEQLLSSPWYQQKIAAAIAQGVRAYFWKFPPPDSLFALQKNAKKYVVAPGNTMAIIAARYQVTSAVLMRMNNLASSAVHPGQILMVPQLSEEN